MSVDLSWPWKILWSDEAPFYLNGTVRAVGTMTYCSRLLCRNYSKGGSLHQQFSGRMVHPHISMVREATVIPTLHRGTLYLGMLEEHVLS
ncbi:hypothetical protein TNCV_1180761 [Trichonephila clavipes]|nr:hypothetical protein TNCV_1180761 [Trichonephila clavipes]